MSTNEVKEVKKQTSDIQNDIQDDYSLDTVPKDKRRSLIATATVWIGWCISLSAFMTGGTIGSGSTAGNGILAVFAGNLVH